MGLFNWKKKETFLCPMTGIVHPMEDVPDPVFSQKIMGDGFAVELTAGEVKAPLSGQIAAAFPTGHAFGIRTKNGLEVLLHIGIDTVSLEGKGFQVKVKEGDFVKQGDILVIVDVNYIKTQGKSVYSPVIFTSGQKIILNKTGLAAAGDENIITITN
ncbi:MAG: PTS glucose transporter subunit IIA [Lachnospiraceae bacterium]|nr:PTS glucose transporter subunit IIA [Lachnospiraceae bacterium]